jgi:hypothetical protein
MDASQSDGIMMQTGFPSTSAISVFNTRSGGASKSAQPSSPAPPKNAAENALREYNRDALGCEPS